MLYVNYVNKRLRCYDMSHEYDWVLL